MKKIFALLLIGILTVFTAVPVFADEFIPSVEQQGSVDVLPDDMEPSAETSGEVAGVHNNANAGNKAPQTGEEFPILPTVGAVVFAAAAVIIFIVAGKKKKKRKSNYRK